MNAGDLVTKNQRDGRVLTSEVTDGNGTAVVEWDTGAVTLEAAANLSTVICWQCLERPATTRIDELDLCAGCAQRRRNR